MARGIVWTDRAEADLDEIWRYTERQWGEEQADRYISGMHALIADEEKRKLRARRIDFVRPGWFRMRYVRHLLYFREDGESIRVMRVLHDSMDETLHLP